jgi:hypothetical protein
VKGDYVVKIKVSCELFELRAKGAVAHDLKVYAWNLSSDKWQRPQKNVVTLVALGEASNDSDGPVAYRRRRWNRTRVDAWMDYPDAVDRPACLFDQRTAVATDGDDCVTATIASE